jgi:hypothetical protein
MGPPGSVKFTVSRGTNDTDFDLTTVSSVDIKVAKPTGATVTWTGSTSDVSASAMTVTYLVDADDIDVAGRWTAYLKLYTSGGAFVRTDSVNFDVDPEY